MSETPIIIDPNCCEESKNGAIFLGWPYNYADEEDICRLKIHPVWLIRGYFKEFESIRNFIAKHCPFCGKLLPKIRIKKELPKNLILITDGGYYCDNCNERLHSCKCERTVTAWEADL